MLLQLITVTVEGIKTMHNDIKEVLFTTEQIEAKAAELATRLEVEYADKKPDVTRFIHYAGRFAAKEAIYKSLSKIDNTVSLSEIEILNDKTNKNRPVVNILKPNISKMQEECNLIIDVSISHIKDFATANAISYLN